MPLTEFDLIRDYLTDLGTHREDVLVGVGDDAACVQVPPGVSVVTVAASIRGAACHCTTGERFGYLSFAHAVLRTIATGGCPVWATLALTLPELREDWLRGFSRSLDALAKDQGISLVGGDSTQGPLVASIFMSALVDARHDLQNRDVQSQHAIYVTGTIGSECSAPLAMAPLLRSFASAATDVRGGLRDSVTRLLEPRSLGANLWHDRLAIAVLVDGFSDAEKLLSTPGLLALCCLVPSEHRRQFEHRVQSCGVTTTEVGVVEERPGVRLGESASVS